MNKADYREMCKPHERALRQLLLEFEYFRQDVPGVIVISVESRIKTLQSAEEKSRRDGIPVQQLYDLAGARIVVGTSQTVEAVRRFFSRQESSKELVVEKDEPVVHASGYRSHHLVVKYEPHYARSLYDARVEVQIPTVFQHAWNQLSRTWVYKADRSFADDWKERFEQLSQRLDELNQLAAKLHSDVVLSAESREGRAPLSPFSYQILVREEFGEVEPMEYAVDAVTFLGRVGINTNEKLLLYLRDARLRRLWEEFRAYAELGNDLARSMTGKKTVFWSILGFSAARFAEDLLGGIRKEYPEATGQDRSS